MVNKHARSNAPSSQLSKRLHGRSFISVPLEQLLRSDIAQSYPVKLGDYFYHYIVVADLLNEVLISLTTTSRKIIENFKKELSRPTIFFIYGKYALTYEDRFLTCGSFKILDPSPNSETVISKIPWVKKLKLLYKKLIDSSQIYVHLASYSFFIDKDRLNKEFRPFNRNTLIVGNSQGEFARAGMLLGIIDYIPNYRREKVPCPPFIECSSELAKVKAIACRPVCDHSNGCNDLLKCFSINFESVLSSRVPIKPLLEPNSRTRGLITMYFSHTLPPGKPIISYVKEDHELSLNYFLLGKSFIFSSLACTQNGFGIRLWVEEKRLKNIYLQLAKEVNYRLGLKIAQESVDSLITRLVNNSYIIKVDEKLTPMSPYLYKKLPSFSSLIYKREIDKYVEKTKDCIYLPNSKIPGYVRDFSNRIMAISPLAFNERIYLIV